MNTLTKRPHWQCAGLAAAQMDLPVCGGTTTESVAFLLTPSAKGGVLMQALVEQISCCPVCLSATSSPGDHRGHRGAPGGALNARRSMERWSAPKGRGGDTVTHTMGKKSLLGSAVITPVVLKTITGSTEAIVSSTSWDPTPKLPLCLQTNSGQKVFFASTVDVCICLCL